MTPIPPPLDLAGVGLQGAPGSARLSPLLSQRGQPVPLWAPAGAAVSPSVPPRPPAPLGQKTLTVLCIAAGALMAIVAALGCFNVFQLVTSPFVYILNAFEVAFGVLTVLLEVNPWGYLSAHLRLMTTPVGKLWGQLGRRCWPWVARHSTRRPPRRQRETQNRETGPGSCPSRRRDSPAARWPPSAAPWPAR
eukprot:Polyplicarium_translucidae@DN3145_c0_g1_i1.p1